MSGAVCGPSVKVILKGRLSNHVLMVVYMVYSCLDEHCFTPFTRRHLTEGK